MATETRITSEQGKEAVYQAHLSKDAIEKINGLVASASEIDGNILSKSKAIRKNYDKASSLNLFGKAINILGDSHTVGIGSSTTFKAYKELLRLKLVNLYGNFNFGTDTSLGYQSLTGFTYYRNNEALDCLTGFYMNIVSGTDFPIRESSSYTPIDITNKKIKILCPLTEVGKTLEIYCWTGSESATATLTVGADGFTNEYSIANYNEIRIRNTNTTTALRVETYYLYTDTSYYGLNSFASSGRALSHVSDSSIDRWFDNAEIAILALGTNDNSNATFDAKIEYIKAKYNAQKFTKLIILDLDITRARTSETRQKLKQLHHDCKGSYFINLSEEISYVEASASELYSLGIVKSDLGHYNDNGHEFIADLIYKSIFA